MIGEVDGDSHYISVPRLFTEFAVQSTQHGSLGSSFVPTACTLPLSQIFTAQNQTLRPITPLQTTRISILILASSAPGSNSFKFLNVICKYCPRSCCGSHRINLVPRYSENNPSIWQSLLITSMHLIGSILCRATNLLIPPSTTGCFSGKGIFPNFLSFSFAVLQIKKSTTAGDTHWVRRKKQVTLVTDLQILFPIL